MVEMTRPSLFLLAVLLLAACSGSPATSAATPQTETETPKMNDGLAQPHAFKGMELYSWSTREGGRDVFHYALTIGTNRRKGVAEIQSTPLTLEQVKAEISKLPAGESLSWITQLGDGQTLPLPPAETIEELIAAAHARRIDLWVEGYSDP
jgi:hypothetical protein